MRWWIYVSVLLLICSIVIAEKPTYQYNKIYVHPFYRESMTNNVNYNFNVTVNPPDGLSKTINAMINFQIYITPTVTFYLTVDGINCRPPSFLVHTTYMDTGYSLVSFDCSNIINRSKTYNIVLRPSGANTGAVYGWLDLTYMNNPLGTTEIFGTEYLADEAGTIFLQLKDSSGEPVDDGTCYLDIYYPNLINQTHPELIEKAPMLYKTASEGMYYYDLTIPKYKGIYMLSATCSYQYAGSWVYSIDGTEVNKPKRTSTSGTYSGDTIFLNDYEDWIYTLCASSGGGTKSCDSYYDFNITHHFSLPLNASNIDLYYMGEASVKAVMTFYVWNWTSSTWKTLTNTLTFSGLATSVPIGIGDFASNKLPITDIVSTDGIIRIRTQATFGSNFNLYSNWLNIRILDTFGVVVDLKGSGEIHVSERVGDYPFDVITLCNNSDEGCAIFYEGDPQPEGYILDNITIVNTNRGVLNDIYYYTTALGTDCSALLELRSYLPDDYVNYTDIVDDVVTRVGLSENCIISIPVDFNEGETIRFFQIFLDNYPKWEIIRANDLVYTYKPVLNSYCDEIASDLGESYVLPLMTTLDNITNESFKFCYRVKDDLWYFDDFYNSSLTIIDVGTYEEYLSELRWYYKEIEESYKLVKFNIIDDKTALINYTFINEGVWNYTIRNLTYYPPATVINYTAITENVWTRSIRTLTNISNLDVDIGNAVWNSGNYTINVGLLTQVVSNIWEYVGRYTHGVIT